MQWILAASILIAGCARSAPEPGVPQPPSLVRRALHHPDAQLAKLLLSPPRELECLSDAECRATGCNGASCLREDAPVDAGCATPVAPPSGAACGCVGGLCNWFTVGQLAGLLGRPCPRGECPRGLDCVRYSASPGPSGSGCELLCGLEAPRCPVGLQCVPILEGLRACHLTTRASY